MGTLTIKIKDKRIKKFNKKEISLFYFRANPVAQIFVELWYFHSIDKKNIMLIEIPYQDDLVSEISSFHTELQNSLKNKDEDSEVIYGRK